MDEDGSAQQSGGALVPMHLAESIWRPIFHSSTQVVLYNPQNHALTVRHSRPSSPTYSRCPYCKRPMNDKDDSHNPLEAPFRVPDGGRAPNYFELLAISNEETSERRTAMPAPSGHGMSTSAQGRLGTPEAQQTSSAFASSALAEGYFAKFFQEERRLGMGANGSVYLCQHLLDGTPLGHFAVKKIAVGESHSYLLRILKEVRLLERLHHPNIVTYHHSWLETSQFSAFGPRIPTLHVLMQWAEGGSLDDFISARLGRSSSYTFAAGDNSDHLFSPEASSPPSRSDSFQSHISAASEQSGLRSQATPEGEDTDPLSRAARIRAFREMQRATPEERACLQQELRHHLSEEEHGPTWMAIHLLSPEEIICLFCDIIEGLTFLHNHSVLHLDLKPGNVLLTWESGRLIPRAMLSDFGTSRDMMRSSSQGRSGNTGTLEYTAPETLPSPSTGKLREISSQADMWSLGMVLHKLLFFRLPYRHSSDAETNKSEGSKMDHLEAEVLTYPGFKQTPHVAAALRARRIPPSYLTLLEGLLSVTPVKRPSCKKVREAIINRKLDPLSEDELVPTLSTSMFTLIRRPVSPSRRISDDAVPQQPAVAEDGVDHAIIEEDEPITPDTRSELPFVDKRETLYLTAPALEAEPYVWPYVRIAEAIRRLPPDLTLRCFKSATLIAKVSSLSAQCLQDVRLPSAVVYVLMALALVDTLIPYLTSTVALSIIHVTVLKYFCSGEQCCI